MICERGSIARVEKGYNVAQGDAAGMLLYNPEFQGLATDNHYIPTVHLEKDAGDSLLKFFDSHNGVTATFTPGTSTQVQGDIMAPFSSRGGPGQSLGISKPDITAPGVGVRSCFPGTSYGSASGTSMAGPHVVGQVALLWSADPTLIGKIDETVELIRKTAVPQTTSQNCGGIEGSEIPNNTWGWGKIDVYKAVTTRLNP